MLISWWIMISPYQTPRFQRRFKTPIVQRCPLCHRPRPNSSRGQSELGRIIGQIYVLEHGRVEKCKRRLLQRNWGKSRRDFMGLFRKLGYIYNIYIYNIMYSIRYIYIYIYYIYIYLYMHIYIYVFIYILVFKPTNIGIRMYIKFYLYALMVIKAAQMDHLTWITTREQAHPCHNWLMVIWIYC